MQAMAHRDPAETIHAWFELVWNQGNLDAIDELLSADSKAHGLTNKDGSPVIGPAQFREFAHAFRSAFPDIHVEVVRCVIEGSFCAAHCILTGTHHGATLGFAATGRAVRFEGVGLVRIENGQIHEGWNFFDFLSMYQQLGALPALPA